MTEYITKDQGLAALREYQMGGKTAKEIICAIPAADVRPVVRGQWQVSAHRTYYDVSCSVCGINSFFQVDEKDSISYANFCPNCGADMREEPPKEET